MCVCSSRRRRQGENENENENENNNEIQSEQPDKQRQRTGKMLIKFESKSNRVKGLSFHPTRPWVLASLHSGSIQLWDYQMGTLIDTFDEHEGPVRGVDFHSQQPLFVSGGDDYKVKIWNHKLRRCLFTMTGHLDYIRTVSFHKEYPWVVSASDDQTIRIWNWQNRKCISVLTGHSHYVMCAAFHPEEDIVASASLDQTVRVWDTSGLRKKTVRGVPDMASMGGGADGHPMHANMMARDRAGSAASQIGTRVNNELFGSTDAVVKYVLEGHERGVNWVSFHPTLPLIVSAADDRVVKLWRMNETKAYEIDTLRGHTNNVSSVLFHPKLEVIVSNSEDRSVRVWDVNKRLGIQTYRRDSDRFWIVAAHPTQNLLAAGHDCGLMVFKLQRERPAYSSHKRLLFYAKERYLRMYDLPSKRDVPIVSLRRSSSATALGASPWSLTYNTLNQSGETNVLVWTKASNDSSYELVTFRVGGGASGGSGSGQVSASEPARGSGLAAVFIARNRFAVLDKSRMILIKNMNNEMTKRCQSPLPAADRMYPAGLAGRVLLAQDDKVILFETNSRRFLQRSSLPDASTSTGTMMPRWSPLSAKAPSPSATGSSSCSRSSRRSSALKSGAWDEHGIFVYTTLNHIKYALPNVGEECKGLIRTLSVPLYITKVYKGVLYYLDRECKPGSMKLDLAEAMFKLALSQGRFLDVMRMVKQADLCGEAIIAYLQKKGYPQVALHFVKEPRTRFDLALECGDIKVATETASEINEADCWEKLGAAALQQGKASVVEKAYQQCRNFERLSFHYLITGNSEYLGNMLKIAQMRKDRMARYHNALYIGDAEERVRVLEEAGQLTLAYLTAKTNGLQADVERLAGRIQESGGKIPDAPKSASLLQPPTPIYRMGDWPEVDVGVDEFTAAVRAAEEAASTSRGDEKVNWATEAGGNVGPDQLVGDFQGTGGDEAMGNDGLEDDIDMGFDADDLDDGNDAWGGSDDDLDFGDDDLDLDDEGNAGDASMGDADGLGSSFFVAPMPRPPLSSTWVEKSSIAGDHVAAGSFSTAMKLLNRQIGIVNFAPLKEIFLAVAGACQLSMPGLGNTAAITQHVLRKGDESLPRLSITLPQLVSDLKVGYRLFYEAKTQEALACFDRFCTKCRSWSYPVGLRSTK